MAGRYSEHKLISYCFNPRTIVRDGEKYTVPCGKCNGCLLHKSNVWSSRIQHEIENNPYSIFVTFTFNNKYLPTLKRVSDSFGKGAWWISDHPDNIRFDGVKDVRRQDRIMVFDKYDSIPIQNDVRTDVINYCSKRDFQLYFKLLKEDLKLQFYERGHFFRYFGVSEIGPTTLRNHAHFIFFCESREISEYLLHESLYKNWQMCDEGLFKYYSSYCDAGTASYVANYVNCINGLPKIYQNRELRPFRLSSKSPAIGYSSYDKAQIQESFIEGDGTFVRTIRKSGQNHIVCYSSEYLRGLFPKCYRYSEFSFDRLLYVYGYLYRAIKGTGFSYLLLSSRLSKIEHPANWQAMKKCYDYCEEFGCTPFHYVYVLDQIYYKIAMRALKMQYEFLESKRGNYMASLALYLNLVDYIERYAFLSSSEKLMLDYFFEDYHIYDCPRKDDLFYNDPEFTSYVNEVSDIVSNMQKMPKFNELTGRSPHIV